MNMETIRFLDKNIPLHRCDVLVIGSGCAAWNAADCLYDFGVKNILVVSEGLNMGTSRNTGSDKQTYYKLAMQAGQKDSVDDMARALMAGRSVNGDTAYVEAANSARCFLKLAEMGVPFPTNAYGEFVGYQTDHTTTKRASSAGPLTSKYMTEVLEISVRSKNIPVLDGITVIELLKDENGVIGALGIDKNGEIHAFLTGDIICATGGPAAVYQNSVYPPSQTGMTGMLIDCGVECANLQEWQYGMASVKFRWNLSGTYQQVLPAYISVDKDGVRREFLKDYFTDPAEALDLVFLKGYQWPFDYAKLDGSSIIDMLVYHEEIELGRTVFLDYRTNPAGLENGFDTLGSEAYDYLKHSNALFGTPIDRLEKMNPAAIELYRSHGIDLYAEPLQVTIAAQHNNGGAAVDTDWQTNIRGLYAAGEAAGTFGVYRPGGSALNATQVGSLRAAEHISRALRKAPADISDISKYSSVCREFFTKNIDENANIIAELDSIRSEMPRLMSLYGAHVRDAVQLEKLLETADENLTKLMTMCGKLPESMYVKWFKTRDMLITQKAMIQSMLCAYKNIQSRGGSVFCSLPVVKAGEKDVPSAIKSMKKTENTDFDSKVLYYCSGACSFREVRPMPEEDNWFETVWAEYRERQSHRTREDYE